AWTARGPTRSGQTFSVTRSSAKSTVPNDVPHPPRWWWAAISSSFHDQIEAVSRSHPAASATPGISDGVGPWASRAAAPTSKRYTGGGEGSTGAGCVMTAAGGVGSGGGGGGGVSSAAAGGGTGGGGFSAIGSAAVRSRDGAASVRGGGLATRGGGGGLAARGGDIGAAASRSTAAGSSASTMTRAIASAVSAQVGAVRRRSDRDPLGHAIDNDADTARGAAASTATRSSGPPAALSFNRIRAERRAISFTTSARPAQSGEPVTASDATTAESGSLATAGRAADAAPRATNATIARRACMAGNERECYHRGGARGEVSRPVSRFLRRDRRRLRRNERRPGRSKTAALPVRHAAPARRARHRVRQLEPDVDGGSARPLLHVQPRRRRRRRVGRPSRDARGFLRRARRRRRGQLADVRDQPGDRARRAHALPRVGSRRRSGRRGHLERHARRSNDALVRARESGGAQLRGEGHPAPARPAWPRDAYVVRARQRGQLQDLSDVAAELGPAVRRAGADLRAVRGRRLGDGRVPE